MARQRLAERGEWLEYQRQNNDYYVVELLMEQGKVVSFSWVGRGEVHMVVKRRALDVGDVFENGRPDWGRGRFMVVQVFEDGEKVLYRLNIGKRDERERWYVIGGQHHGLKKMSNV